MIFFLVCSAAAELLSAGGFPAPMGPRAGADGTVRVLETPHGTDFVTVALDEAGSSARWYELCSCGSPRTLAALLPLPAYVPLCVYVSPMLGE